MSVSRREFLALGGALALMPATSAVASDLNFIPSLILENFEKSLWLSSNRSADRAVYVIAAPWCPFCKQLYHAQSEVDHDIDFRYVFQQFRRFGPAVLNAFFLEENDQLGIFYNDPFAPTAVSDRSVKFFDEINVVTTNKMASAIGSLLSGVGGSGSSGAYVYPTVVYRKDDDGIVALAGAWDELKSIDRFSATPAANAPTPSRFKEMITAPPVGRGIRRNFFAERDGVLIYSAPTTSAPQIDVFSEGSGFEFDLISQVNGEEWLGVRLFSGFDGVAWGRRADFFTQ